MMQVVNAAGEHVGDMDIGMPTDPTVRPERLCVLHDEGHALCHLVFVYPDEAEPHLLAETEEDVQAVKDCSLFRAS